jgi:hypothetical protein
MAVFVSSLIITILNVIIVDYVRSSTARVQLLAFNITTNATNNIPQAMISCRDLFVLRQMIFTFLIYMIGWTPVYLTLIISYFIYVNPDIASVTAITSQLCKLSIISNAGC